MINGQEYKIECNGTNFFFVSNSKSAYRQVKEFIERNEGCEIKVYYINNLQFGERWIPITI